MNPAGREFQDDICRLLGGRDAASTICPSEVARLRGDGWRELMDEVRRAAASLAARGVVVATRRGEIVDPLAGGGPIRLGRGPRFATGNEVSDEQVGKNDWHADM